MKGRKEDLRELRTMTTPKNSSRFLVGRIFLVLLCLCGIAQNRCDGTQNGVPQNGEPAHCDTGISRHSLQAAALVDKTDFAAPAKSDDPHGAPDGMIWIPGGPFWMGTDHMEDAQPVHQVEVRGFWMDRTDVTNEEFARFVKATGYVTIAERPLDRKEFPNLAQDELTPGSVVFTPPGGPV